MEESYWESMNSGVADMVNTGPSQGGIITAALFLQQRKQVSSSPAPKVGSSKKKNKSAGISKQNKESANISPSSMVRGKRTPRKDMKRGQKGVSQRAEYLKMGRSKDSETKAKPLKKEEPLSNEGGSSAGEEDSGKMEKSRSIEKQVKDAESSSSDTASSQENEPNTENVDIIPSDGEGSDESNKKEADKMNKSDSEENEEDGADSESTDAETPDRKGSASEDSDMAVFSDDEPLGVWKSRVGKSVLGK